MSAANRRRASRLRHLVALVLACASVDAVADDPAFNTAAGIPLVSGEQIYVHICQGCHMPEGQGAVGAGHYPKLALDSALVSWQYVALTVLNGKNGMPSFGQPASHVTEFGAVTLSDAQIAEVANYVRSHFGNKWKDKASTAQVAVLPHPK